MPNSLPTDPQLEAPVEDIFSDTPLVEPVIVTEDSTTVSSLAAAPLATRGGRRRWLLIATGVLALLLLSGGALAIWLWLQAPPTVTNDIPDTNTTVLNTNVTDTIPITNANAVVNVNETPINTNTHAQSFVDVDHDGLTDEEELLENTNPKKKDTDEDGLSDREEVRVYATDPRNPDTDADGYTDGDEVTHFYHPNNPDPKKRLFDLPQ